MNRITFHDDEPVVDNSQLKESDTRHEDVIKVVEVIIVRVQGSVVILIELLHCGVPVHESSSVCYRSSNYSHQDLFNMFWFPEYTKKLTKEKQNVNEAWS